MEQYIPKDALVAEIERRIEHNTEWKDACKTLAVLAANQAIEEDKKILSFIDSLEVKEVDLEKEVDNWRHLHFHGRRDKGASGEYLERISQLELAKHFFELGLKAQITTSKLQQRIGVLKMSFWTGLQTFEETEMTLLDAYNQGVDDILEELGLKARKGE